MLASDGEISMKTGYCAVRKVPRTIISATAEIWAQMQPLDVTAAQIRFSAIYSYCFLPFFHVGRGSLTGEFGMYLWFGAM